MGTFGHPPKGEKEMSHLVIEWERVQIEEKAGARAIIWEHWGYSSTIGGQCVWSIANKEEGSKTDGWRSGGREGIGPTGHGEDLSFYTE